MPAHVAIGSMSRCCHIVSLLFALSLSLFLIFQLSFDFLIIPFMFVFFFFFVVVFFCILIVLCFCIVLCTLSSRVYSCLFSICVQVYRPLPPRGNPTAVNVISRHNQTRFAFD